MTFHTKKIFLACALGVLSLGLFSPLHTQKAHGATTTAAVCEIRGTVAGLQRVSTIDVPSPLAGQETHISVSISKRSSRYKKFSSDNDPCDHQSSAEMRTYKLCSPTQVKKGDIIHGTEGTETGPSAPVGCLFDLVVISKK